MSDGRHSETAFETVIEAHLLANGYVRLDRDGFDRDRAIFPEAVLDFIRETQPAEWARLEALHGSKTGEQVLADLCKWMDTNGSLATLPRLVVVPLQRAGRGLAPRQDRARPTPRHDRSETGQRYTVKRYESERAAGGIRGATSGSCSSR